MIRKKHTEEEKEFLKSIEGKYTRKKMREKYIEQFEFITETNFSNLLFKWKIKSNGLNSGAFKKGCIPFNKGLKREEYMSKQGQERCRETQFSKDKIVNNQDHKVAPVGAEYADKDGYILVKTNKRGKQKSHPYWKQKHHLIYEQHYGEIPKGYKVIFADGNKRNFDINNLVMVSNAELMIINDNGLYYKGNAELTKIGVIISKILVKGKERKRDAKK